MNIFKDYKATKFFIDAVKAIEETRGREQADLFSKWVKAKFHEKVTSDEQLEDYKLTVSDLADILEKFSNATK